jgi:hypothetical protein
MQSCRTPDRFLAPFPAPLSGGLSLVLTGNKKCFAPLSGGLSVIISAIVLAHQAPHRGGVSAKALACRAARLNAPPCGGASAKALVGWR